MNDFAQEISQHIVAVIISAIIMILLIMAACEWSEPTPQVAPYVPIRQQVLSYPYRDNSRVLRAAEAKINRQIGKIEAGRSAINTEINECFESCSSSTGTDKDALKLAYKLYKALNKDKTKAQAMQFEYDKMADLLITDREQPGLFDRDAND